MLLILICAIIVQVKCDSIVCRELNMPEHYEIPVVLFWLKRVGGLYPVVCAQPNLVSTQQTYPNLVYVCEFVCVCALCCM